MTISTDVVLDARTYAPPNSESGPVRDVVTKTFFFTLVLSAFVFVLILTTGVLP
jgi:hypothetical protein